MRSVSIFMNARNQAVQLLQDMAFDGIGELEISKEGDVITLRPARPSWTSLTELPKADANFLQECIAVVRGKALRSFAGGMLPVLCRLNLCGAVYLVLLPQFDR